MNFAKSKIIEGLKVQYVSYLLSDGKCLMVHVEGGATQPAASWIEAWELSKKMVDAMKRYKLARSVQRDHRRQQHRRAMPPSRSEYVPLTVPVCKATPAANDDHCYGRAAFNV